MSGRGTIKAGTFSGRRYREKVVSKTKQTSDLQKKIAKKQRELTKPHRRVPTSSLKPETGRYAGQLKEELRGTIRPSQFKAGAQSGKGRDIQLAINTIPYLQDTAGLRLMREELEQSQREELHPDVDFEDDFMDAMDDDDVIAEGFGVGAHEADEDLNVAEAGEVAGFDAEGDEEGGMEYGTDLLGVAEDLDALDMGLFFERPEGDDTDDEELNDMMGGMEVGVDVNALGDAMQAVELDSDEEAEEFGRQLDAVQTTQERLKDAIVARRAQRAGGLSVAPGERVPYESTRHISGHETADASAGGGRTKDEAEQDPEWHRRYGRARDRPTGRYIKGLAPGPEKHPQKKGLDYYKRVKMSKAEIKEADAKGIKHDGTKLDVGKKGMKPTPELAQLEAGRVMDLRPGHIGKDISANQPWLKGGLAGGTKGKGFEGGTRSKITDKALRQQLGWQHGKRKEWELGIGIKRDPKTRKPLREELEGDRVDVVSDLRKAKGHKPLYGKYGTGEIIEEDKKLSITGRQKAISGAWGLDRKGMSRDEDNPAQRDPWAGSRAVMKAPSAQATKTGFHGGGSEADTKRALYVKTQREKDPDWVPQGYRGFQYGAGQTEWDDKKTSRKKETIIGAKGGVAYTPEPINQSAQGMVERSEGTLWSGVDAQEIEALKDYQSTYDPDPSVPAFPGAESIFAPRSTIGAGFVSGEAGAGVSYTDITNPPMNNLSSHTLSDQKVKERVAQRPADWANRKHKERYKAKGEGRAWERMSEYSASEIENMSWDEISTAFAGGGMY